MQFFWLKKQPPTKNCKLLFSGTTLGRIIFFRGDQNIAKSMESVGGYVFEVATADTPKIDQLMHYSIENKKESPFIRTIQTVFGPHGESHTVWVYLANDNLRSDLVHENSTIAN